MLSHSLDVVRTKYEDICFENAEFDSALNSDICNVYEFTQTIKDDDGVVDRLHVGRLLYDVKAFKEFLVECDIRSFIVMMDLFSNKATMKQLMSNGLAVSEIVKVSFNDSSKEDDLGIVVRVLR